MHRAVLILLILILLAACYIAGAEEKTQYILCNPKPTNHVEVRRSPRKDAEETGRLDCGDYIVTDGKTRNGYLHVIGITEYGEGWVHSGYVVDDPPVIEKCSATVTASGRVMSYNRIGGRKNGWINVCTDVKVYARSDEWAVTSKGFIRMKYLEVWHE